MVVERTALETMEKESQRESAEVARVVCVFQRTERSAVGSRDSAATYPTGRLACSQTLLGLGQRTQMDTILQIDTLMREPLRNACENIPCIRSAVSAELLV